MMWTVDHASPRSLQEQIAASVRRALAEGHLAAGERLPPAQELADAIAVDRNTVLAAYRQLRDAGVLEFRRGRGVRVADQAQAHPAVENAARELVELANRYGYSRGDLTRMIEELT
jgi:GntR family transcriptional regulator